MHQQSNYAIGNPFNKMFSANTFLDLITQGKGVNYFKFWHIPATCDVSVTPSPRTFGFGTSLRFGLGGLDLGIGLDNCQIM